MRTRPDQNQDSIVDAIGHCGGIALDLHDVPKALPEHAGLPDLFVVLPEALTIISDDPRRIVNVLANCGITCKVIYGGVVPVEVKRAGERLRAEQERWWEYHGLKPVVMQSVDEVLEVLR